ncbi:MAG: type II toxin-antitoxin system VapC family toxin [Planctomycetes bacterium]|nr:type II toxin-antitoxin system VapC family toxin [Planctomycetota bacterium]
MIVLDTHIWIWWVDGNVRLTENQRQHIQTNQANGLGISVISCWEVAKLVELGRLELLYPVKDWIEQALLYPGISLLNLTPEIAIQSTQLPGTFHRDPADQILVATAKVWDCPILTMDSKILNYAHVQRLK